MFIFLLRGEHTQTCVFALGRSYLRSTSARPTLPLLLTLVAFVIPGPGGAQVSIHPTEGLLPQCAAMIFLLQRELQPGFGDSVTQKRELNFRPQGLALFPNVPMSRQLRTFDLPVTILKLDLPHLLDMGTMRKVICSLEGLCPASEVRIFLELGDKH
ncbi:hypothetical protein LEMLEM_LOCUS15800 [Lemmus lemmus]